MGGMGSGRYGGRPTVEDALALDLSRLLRDRLIRPGATIVSSLHWKNTRTGAEIASIGYSCRMSADAGTFVADYAVTRRGERVPVTLSIGLASFPQPFGGRRWWWICPVTGRRVAKLYNPLAPEASRLAQPCSVFRQCAGSRARSDRASRSAAQCRSQ